MPYAHRPIHDADAHVMETADWLREHADPDIRARLGEIYLSTVAPGEDRLIERYRACHADPEYRAEDADQLLLRKNWAATGSFIKEDRPRALDLLGFESQLIFNTFINGKLLTAERGDDVDFAYGMARAHNRAMMEFCSVDSRLLGTTYVPLRDFERSKGLAREALKMGGKALLVPSGCPRGHSPSHVGLDPVWAQAEEAGLPIVFHVGGGHRAADDKLLDSDYFENGGPAVPDFHGGDENFRSVDYMAIPTAPMQTLATMSRGWRRRLSSSRTICSKLSASQTMLCTKRGAPEPGGVEAASWKIRHNASERRWAAVRGRSSTVTSLPCSARAFSQSASYSACT